MEDGAFDDTSVDGAEAAFSEGLLVSEEEIWTGQLPVIRFGRFPQRGSTVLVAGVTSCEHWIAGLHTIRHQLKMERALKVLLGICITQEFRKENGSSQQ